MAFLSFPFRSCMAPLIPCWVTKSSTHPSIIQPWKMTLCPRPWPRWCSILDGPGWNLLPQMTWEMNSFSQLGEKKWLRKGSGLSFQRPSLWGGHEEDFDNPSIGATQPRATVVIIHGGTDSLAIVSSSQTLMQEQQRCGSSAFTGILLRGSHFRVVMVFVGLCSLLIKEELWWNRGHSSGESILLNTQKTFFQKSFWSAALESSEVVAPLEEYECSLNDSLDRIPL